MQGTILRKALLLLAIAGISLLSEAQPSGIPPTETGNEKSYKPFRILTNGKSVTIKSSKTIRSVMVWTSSGNRVLEEKKLNTSSYNFRVQVNEKIFFVMVQLVDGKTYSEKIGVQ
jgi:hypothetical protein